MIPHDSLNVRLPSDRQIEMSRLFDAPRTLVFKTLTTPSLVQRWLLGPPGWTMPVCEIDLRVGGAFRYEWRHLETGQTMGLRGVYREIIGPARLTHSETFDQSWFAGECLCVQTLDETNGQTLLTTTLTYDSRDVRDAVLKSNMTKGVTASYQQLADVLTKELP
jgi:uncharacterized protein YndB with AHSA1/START domain